MFLLGIFLKKYYFCINIKSGQWAIRITKIKVKDGKQKIAKNKGDEGNIRFQTNGAVGL